MECSLPTGWFFSLLEASACYITLAFYEIPACFLTLVPASPSSTPWGPFQTHLPPGSPFRCLTSPGFLGPLWSRTKATALSRIPLIPVFTSFRPPGPPEKACTWKRLSATSCWPNSPTSTTRSNTRLSEQRALPLSGAFPCCGVLQWGCPVPFLMEGPRGGSADCFSFFSSC